ncbi:uncharacterized protein [Typha angustifolia]|uniref:uncharacterized protein n=1 Tax=Typha angustifolia TaxID=59011 RepID=UPI003C3001C1
METPLRVGFLGPRCSQFVSPKSSLLAGGFLRGHAHRVGRRSLRVSFFRGSLRGSDIAGEDVMQIFLKERQLNGDFISKASDMLWGGNDFKVDELETTIMQENIQQYDEVVEDETNGGFLKLTTTRDWISGDISAPVNKKLVAKNWQDESEKRRKLNILKYEAIKSELLLLTTGIGAACSVYCLLNFSVEVAASYALGVLFSCLYLQLLCYHTDNLSKEAIPEIFLGKKLKKKIGIRSEDLKNSVEKILSGTTVSLSSPRLVIPAAIYGFWALSNHFHNDLFEFQLVPGMMGFFAYKAAALVQVYRDNEDLRLIFPDYEDPE